jgi:hypothetical protein
MLTMSPPPALAPPPRAGRRSSSALVVADEGSYAQALTVLAEAVDLADARVEIVTLPEPLRLGVATFAPLSGLTTHERMLTESLERADRAARAAALALPDVLASYRTLRCWSHIAALIEHGGHDAVVLGCVPRRRQLRRLVAISGATETALLFARPSTACR